MSIKYTVKPHLPINGVESSADTLQPPWHELPPSTLTLHRFAGEDRINQENVRGYLHNINGRASCSRGLVMEVTPLHVALINKNRTAILFLIAFGADVNAVFEGTKLHTHTHIYIYIILYITINVYTHLTYIIYRDIYTQIYTYTYIYLYTYMLFIYVFVYLHTLYIL